jgi:hypothetical protein
MTKTNNPINYAPSAPVIEALIGLHMAKGIQTAGLIILLVAMGLYLLGNTIWLSISVLGFLVEVVGWVVWVSEERGNNGSN